MSYYQPSSWSDWDWVVEHNCYGRYRLGQFGAYEWEYNPNIPVDGIPRNSEELPTQAAYAELHSSYLGGIQSSPVYTQNNNYTSSRNAQDHATQHSYGLMETSPTSTGNVAMYPPLALSATENSGLTTNLITPEDARQAQGRNKNGYKKHKSKDFWFGRILMINWSEPSGKNDTAITPGSVGTHNGYEKYRRFLVIKSSSGHSLCLAISTYNNRGTTKPGCHPETHAVIHSSDKPHIITGEDTNILRSPVLCRMDERNQKLDRASRLNYAKIYTIEHNCEVRFIGRLATASESQVASDFNAVNGPISPPPARSASPRRFY